MKNSKSITLFTALIVLALHFPQLAIIPSPSITSPAIPILVLILIFIHHLNKSSSLSLFVIKKRWLFLLSIYILFFIYSSAFYGLSKEAIRNLVGIISSFLMYWIGYHRLGISHQKFSRIIKKTSYFIFAIFFIELISLNLLPDAHQTLDSIRSSVILKNIDNHRVHLFFSEPSFLASYLIFILYYFIEEKKTLNIPVLIISAIAIASQSITTILTVFVCLFWPYLCQMKIKNTLVILSLPLLLFLLFPSDLIWRLSNLSEDQSGLIRFLHIKALIDMLIETNYLGGGFSVFPNYLTAAINDLNLPILPAELQRNIDGTSSPTPYSLIFGVFGQTGLIGGITLLYILFKNIIHIPMHKQGVVLSLIIPISTALPWGLPYIWIIIGIIDKECEEACPTTNLKND